MAGGCALTPTTKKPKPPHPVVELVTELVKLHAIIDRKCKRLNVYNPWGDRGLPCAQAVGSGDGTFLFIYEGGYRATLFPRLVYKFSGREYSVGDGMVNAVRLAARRERAAKDRVVALFDGRPPCEVVGLTVRGNLAPCATELTGEQPVYNASAEAAGRMSRAAWLFMTGADAEAVRVRAEGRALDPAWGRP